MQYLEQINFKSCKKKAIIKTNILRITRTKIEKHSVFKYGHRLDKENVNESDKQPKKQNKIINNETDQQPKNGQ